MGRSSRTRIRPVHCALAAVWLCANQGAPAFAETAIASAEFGHVNAQGIPVSMDRFPLESTGVGFFVSREGHVVTPFHVAGHCMRLAILQLARAYEATAVAMNPAADIAVLKSAAPHISAELTPASSMAKAAPLVIVRYGHLGGMASRSSVVAHYLGRVASSPINMAARASQGIVGGNSGSPLVLMDGSVAGMVTAVKREDSRIALGIDAHTIAEVLQSASVPFRWQTKKASTSLAAGGATKFTFPVACYVRPKP
jgi:S1-C subfamily serine protease